MFSLNLIKETTMQKRRLLALGFGTGVLLSLMGAGSAFAIQVYSQPVDGAPIVLDVEPSDTIENVKAKIVDKTGGVADTLCLLYEGVFMEDGNTLDYYNVRRETTINQYDIPAVAQWSSAPDEPILGAPFNGQLETLPLPGSSFVVTAGELPGGIAVDPVTGAVSGEFAAEGPFSVTIRTTNICGNADITWSGVVPGSQSDSLPSTGLPLVGVFGVALGAIALGVFSSSAHRSMRRS
jgi:hypothetical protein